MLGREWHHEETATNRKIKEETECTARVLLLYKTHALYTAVMQTDAVH